MAYKEITYLSDLEPSALAQQIIAASKDHYLMHVRNVPFEGDALHDFYEQVTSHVGECLELGETASSLSVNGRWTYVCFDPSIENAYRSTANAQPLHTDGSYQKQSPDATCMYCISNASEGGETVFITGEKLIEALQNDEPELLKQLKMLPVCFSREFVNGDNEKTRPIIIQKENGSITLTWNYYRVDPKSSDEVKQMCDAFHHYLQTHIMGSDKLQSLHLKPGEAILWLDEKVLHGRNSFIAHQFGERNLAKTCLNIKSL